MAERLTPRTPDLQASPVPLFPILRQGPLLPFLSSPMYINEMDTGDILLGGGRRGGGGNPAMDKHSLQGEYQYS